MQVFIQLVEHIDIDSQGLSYLCHAIIVAPRTGFFLGFVIIDCCNFRIFSPIVLYIQVHALSNEELRLHVVVNSLSFSNLIFSSYF